MALSPELQAELDDMVRFQHEIQRWPRKRLEVLVKMLLMSKIDDRNAIAVLKGEPNARWYGRMSYDAMLAEVARIEESLAQVDRDCARRSIGVEGGAS